MNYGHVMRLLDSTLDLFCVSSREFKVCECESRLRVGCQQSWGWRKRGGEGGGGGEKRLRVHLFNGVIRNETMQSDLVIKGWDGGERLCIGFNGSTIAFLGEVSKLCKIDIATF